MEKPDVDHIGGIPPAVAIDQRRPVTTSRSTVGTVTEIHDHLKLLFAKLGVLQCRGCGRRIERATPTGIGDELLREHLGAAVFLGFPFPVPDLPWREVAAGLVREGFTRALVDGEVHALEGVADAPASPVDILVDRLTCKRETRGRLVASLEQALAYGKGRAFVTSLDGRTRREYRAALVCTSCSITYRDPTPNLFSFNSPLGACDACRGFGRIIDLDLDLVIPDASRTLEGGAIKPWTTPSTSEERRELLAFCRRRTIPVDVPMAHLDPAQRRLVEDGDERFFGIRGWFRWLERKTYKMHVRVLLSRYRSYRTCPTCEGSRVKPDALDFRIEGRSIADVNRMNVEEALAFFGALALDAEKDPAAALVARRDPLAADVSGRGRARLSDARSSIADPLRGRARARRSHDRGRIVAGQHAVRARRAVHRPPSARQRAPGRDHAKPLRAPEHGGRRRARSRDHHGGRPCDRHGPGRGRGRWHRGRRRLGRGDHPRPAVSHRPVSFRCSAHSAADPAAGAGPGARGWSCAMPAPTTCGASTSSFRSRAWCASPACRGPARARWSRRCFIVGSCVAADCRRRRPGSATASTVPRRSPR